MMLDFFLGRFHDVMIVDRQQSLDNPYPILLVIIRMIWWTSLRDHILVDPLFVSNYNNHTHDLRIMYWRVYSAWCALFIVLSQFVVKNVVHCRIRLNLIGLYGSLQEWNIKLYVLHFLAAPRFKPTLTPLLLHFYMYCTSIRHNIYYSPQHYLPQHKGHVSMYTVYVALYPLFAKLTCHLGREKWNIWEKYRCGL